jgi:hypothetical protein
MYADVIVQWAEQKHGQRKSTVEVFRNILSTRLCMQLTLNQHAIHVPTPSANKAKDTSNILLSRSVSVGTASPYIIMIVKYTIFIWRIITKINSVHRTTDQYIWSILNNMKSCNHKKLLWVQIDIYFSLYIRSKIIFALFKE